ncbi:MAG: outer membrane beta-barrel protein [Gammaproteobacteria bacterium]|nr:outer membrane beta-barrel protein [Gammaproteobacteria bacterium]
MQLRKKLITAAVMAASAGMSSHTIAAEPGDWLLRLGVTSVDPNEGSSGVVADDAVGADSGTSLSFSFTRMFNKNMGMEILLALPFEHDITLDGVGTIATTEQLPPTVSFEYQFSPDNSVRPYAGVGLNYTVFMNEEVEGVITSLDLDASTGLAINAGVDIDINSDWYFNASVRYIQISTTATTNLGDIDVDIDPYVLTLGVGTTF